MLSVLHKPPPSEYPTEFLVARLQGKKGRLFQDWDRLLSRTDLHELLRKTPLYGFFSDFGKVGIWRYLNHENQWVYIRMNPLLRKLFEPYFALQQAESLLASLRHIHSKGTLEDIEYQMTGSLLSKELMAILTSGKNISEIVSDLEIHLVAISEDFAGLNRSQKPNGV